MGNTPKLLSVPVRRQDLTKVRDALSKSLKFVTVINKFNNVAADSPAYQLQTKLEGVVELIAKY